MAKSDIVNLNASRSHSLPSVSNGVRISRMDLVGALLGEVLSKTKACDDVEDVVVMVESIVQKQRIHLLLMNNYLGKLVTTYKSVLYSTEAGDPTYGTESTKSSTTII